MTARTKTLAAHHKVGVRFGTGPWTSDTAITLLPGDSLLINGQPVPTPEPTPEPVPTPTPTPTHPADTVWYDNFDGTSLDTTKWRVSNYGATGGGRKCCGDAGFNYADQVSVSGGYLRLGANLVNGVWRRGCIDTVDKKLFGFGIWEARIKCPKGKGMWPAFWGYDGSGEELDVLEAGGGADVAMQGVHRYNDSPRDPAVNTTMALSDGFHTFGVEYRSSGIQFSIDGVKRGPLAPRLTKSPAMPLILNLGVGHQSWTAIGMPDSTTPTSNVMLVEWARVRA